MSEVILSKRVVPQPHPMIAPGGDCGPCVLSGLLGWSIPDIYDRLNEGERQGLTWPGMRQALHAARGYGLIDRLIDTVPQWPTHESLQIWGSPSWTQSLQWFRYVRMAIDAGYYGICSISLDRKGVESPGDHWVLLCGVGSVTTPHPTLPAASIGNNVLISCSARNPQGEWIEVGKFLRECGGFNLFLIRPTA